MNRTYASLSHAFLILAAASVLATGAVAQEAPAGSDPGAGTLLATIDGAPAPLPIASMSVQLSVTGPIVRSFVRQTFVNPTDDTLDAVYVFPLPEGAAVDGFEMQIGGRSFVGTIQEKEEARRTYETDDARELEPGGQDRLTLVTCWPQRGWLHSPWRYVVRCERAAVPATSTSG